MKKTEYIAPQTFEYQIQGEVVMNAISNPTTTNLSSEGLGVSGDPYVDEGRVKGSDGWDIWGDAE